MKSKAQIKATTTWDNAHYDKTTIRLPKGMKEKILEVSPSLNGFVIKCIRKELEKDSL